MTDEPGGGIGFQRQMSLDGARFRSSLEDDREPKDTVVAQPGTSALFHGRHRRRSFYHPGAPGSLPVGGPEPEAVCLRAIAPRRAWAHHTLPVQSHRLPNCLIKNLTEIDSLPHLRNLIEISLPIDRMEGKDEVDDERKKVGGEGDGGALPKGEEKGEGRDAGRTDRAY